MMAIQWKYYQIDDPHTIRQELNGIGHPVDANRESVFVEIDGVPLNVDAQIRRIYRQRAEFQEMSAKTLRRMAANNLALEAESGFARRFSETFLPFRIDGGGFRIVV